MPHKMLRGKSASARHSRVRANCQITACRQKSRCVVPAVSVLPNNRQWSPPKCNVPLDHHHFLLAFPVHASKTLPFSPILLTERPCLVDRTTPRTVTAQQPVSLCFTFAQIYSVFGPTSRAPVLIPRPVALSQRRG